MKWIGLLMSMVGSGWSQPAAAPAFEVASIRAVTFPKGTFGGSNGGTAAEVKISGSRVTATMITVRSLILYAYNVKDYQIAGSIAGGAKSAGPAGDLYDLTAKTPGEDPPTQDQVRQMMRGLLADRFQLKLHREHQDLPVYDLIVGKNGPKLKESTGEAKPGIVLTPGEVIRHSFSNQPISELVRWLNRTIIDRPVIDKTGLTGSYDFVLGLTPPADDPDGASIFTAIEKQLGLKLEPANEPMEILVVDSVERRPSAN